MIDLILLLDTFSIFINSKAPQKIIQPIIPLKALKFIINPPMQMLQPNLQIYE